LRSMSDRKRQRSSNSLTYLITGCSRGLGLEFVRQLIDQGDHTIIATCRSPVDASQLKALVRQADTGGCILHMIELDVADEGSIAKLPAQLDLFGVEHIDVLIHNAGISAPTHPIDLVATAKAAVLRQCFDVNAVGPLMITQTLMPWLAGASGRPPCRVLFVSSIMGSIEKTNAGSVSYRASKAALNMIAKCIAGEHGVGTKHDLRITLCHPGWCDTDMGSAGGRSPPVKPADSVAGMLCVVENMGDNSKADFLDYTGSPIGW